MKYSQKWMKKIHTTIQYLTISEYEREGKDTNVFEVEQRNQTKTTKRSYVKTEEIESHWISLNSCS